MWRKHPTAAPDPSVTGLSGDTGYGEHGRAWPSRGPGRATHASRPQPERPSPEQQSRGGSLGSNYGYVWTCQLSGLEQVVITLPSSFLACDGAKSGKESLVFGKHEVRGFPSRFTTGFGMQPA